MVLCDNKVLFPGAGVINAEEFDKQIITLCGDFRGHNSARCNAFNTFRHERRKMLNWLIMKCGLTPVGQPLDNFVNKLFNIFLCDFYDVWALTYPINPTTGSPLPTTRQQVASWFVQAWDRIPEELCEKYWASCG